MTNGQNVNNSVSMSQLGSNTNTYATPTFQERWDAKNEASENKGHMARLGNGIGAFLEQVYEEFSPLKQEERAERRYKERLADERAYNDPKAVAQRYSDAGINPLAVMTNGGPITSQGVSAPESSRASLNELSSIFSLFGNKNPMPERILSGMQDLANIKHTNAQTRLLGEQADAEFQAGYQTWVQNCVQSVLDGNAKDQDGVTEIFQDPYAWEYRYGFTIAEDGKISIVNDYGNPVSGGTGNDGDTLQQSFSHHQNPDGTSSGVLYNVSKFTFTNEKYGTYSIYESSLNMRKHREEVSRLIGLNHTTAEELSQSLADMYVNIAHLVNDGEKAHADTVLALASDLEARFKYGDLFNKKWWIDEIHKAIKDGATVSEAISATVKNFAEAKKAKGKSVSLTETLDDSGKVIGTIWKMAGTLAD